MKFKIGDIVKINKNMWKNRYKEAYVDKVFTVQDTLTAENGETWYTLDDDSIFNWFEEELVLCERTFNISELLQKTNVGSVYKCVEGVGKDLEVTIKDERGILVVYVVVGGREWQLLSDRHYIQDILDMRFIKVNSPRKRVDGKTALIHMLNGGKAYVDEDSTIAYFIEGGSVKTIDLKGCTMGSLLDLSMIMKDDWYMEGEE